MLRYDRRKQHVLIKDLSNYVSCCQATNVLYCNVLLDVLSNVLFFAIIFPLKRLFDDFLLRLVELYLYPQLN